MVKDKVVWVNFTGRPLSEADDCVPPTREGINVSKLGEKFCAILSALTF